MNTTFTRFAVLALLIFAVRADAQWWRKCLDTFSRLAGSESPVGDHSLAAPVDFYLAALSTRPDRLNAFQFQELRTAVADLKSLVEQKLAESGQNPRLHPEGLALLREALTSLNSGEAARFFSYRDLIFHTFAVGRALSPDLSTQAHPYRGDAAFFSRLVEDSIQTGVVFIPIIRDQPLTQAAMLEHMGLPIVSLQLPSQNRVADGRMMTPSGFLVHDQAHASIQSRGINPRPEERLFLMDPSYESPLIRLRKLQVGERRALLQQLNDSWREFIRRSRSVDPTKREVLQNVIFEIFHEPIVLPYRRENAGPINHQSVIPYDPVLLRRLLANPEMASRVTSALTKSIRTTSPNFRQEDMQWGVEWIRDNLP